MYIQLSNNERVTRKAGIAAATANINIESKRGTEGDKNKDWTRIR